MIRKHEVVREGYVLHGWLTTVKVSEKIYEKFFPLRPESAPSSKLWNSYQKKRAQYYDARWKSRDAALQYRKFVTSSSPDAGIRGTGVHGINLDIIFEGSSNQHLCIFVIGLDREIARVAITHERPLQRAWERAVRTWGTHFEIREKDVLKTILAVPDADAFEHLRTHLNKTGVDKIPSAATQILRLQRPFNVSNRRISKQADDTLSTDEATSFADGLRLEIERFQKGRFRRK